MDKGNVYMRRNESEKKEITSFIQEELNNINQLLKEISECKDDGRIYRRAKG